MLYMNEDGTITIDEKPMSYDPEYESAKRRAARERETRNAARYAAMAEEAARLAEIAEENAMTEVDVYGYSEPWFYGCAEAPIVYETGFELWEDDRMECFNDDWSLSDEWLAWDAASEDIPGFFECNLSI